METLQRLRAQFREFWNGLSPSRRFALLATTLAIFLALAAVIFLAPGGQYKTAFSDLSPEEAAAIEARLKTLNIPRRFDATGTAIQVPEERWAEARVGVAAEGIAPRGGKGYELFDESSLGMTPFVQNVNYLRALQAELGRSIMQLEPVSYARVLIARPDPSPFIRDQKPTTASVVLKLKPNAKLTRSAAASITSLVARSVDGLKPENVTVVDSTGRLLSDPHAGEREDLPAGQMEYRRELENHLAAKAEEMLARHLGPGRAIVRVSADINFQKVKERRETYSPEDRAVAAERLTTTKTSGAGPRGVTGVVSNISRTGASPGGGASGSTSSEEVVQTDYLVSRSVRELEDRMGAVQRLTIAVMADLSGSGDATQPTQSITLVDAQEIIKQAVGFRQGRDEIKVSDVRMSGIAPLAGLDEEAAKLQRIQAYVGLARNVSLAVATVLTIALIALLVLRRRRPAPAPVPPADEEKQREEERRRELLDRFIELTRNDPNRVAGVFGMLVGGGAR